MNKRLLLGTLVFVAVLLGVASGGGNVYYYIKETSPAMMQPNESTQPPQWIASILEMNSDTTPTTPPGFTPTTLAEIHSKGYLSPTENSDAAAAAGFRNEVLVDGNHGYSWVNAGWRAPHWKYASPGSSSVRDWFPGWCWLKYETHANNVLKMDFPWTRNWWWSISAADYYMYYETTNFVWNQDGWHWFGSGSVLTTHMQRAW